MSSRFWIMRLPTGRCVIPLLSPAICVANSIMTGIVNKVIILLSAVSDTESATSPFSYHREYIERTPQFENKQ